MAGRTRGGRQGGQGNVSMSVADLNALINDRVSEALAAFQAQQQQQGINTQQQQQQNVNIGGKIFYVTRLDNRP